MKRIYHIALSLGTAAFLLTGCSDSFLDKVPDERVEIDTEDKVVELLNASYPQGNYGWIGEISSDNIMDNNAPHTPANPNVEQVETHYNLGSYGRQDDEMFRFEQCVSATSQDTPSFLWETFYNSIHSANYALEAIDRLAQENGGMSEKLTIAQAEACLIRAYDHFILVNVFSQAYKDSTASKADIGVPYITTPETNTHMHYSRSNVKDVYDRIQEDLEAGLANISDANYNTAPKYHFNVAAAHAFAARFYLFKRDYKKVIEHADEVLGTDTASLRSQLMDWSGFDSCTYSSDYAHVYQTYAATNNIMLFDTQSLIMRHALGYRYAFISTAAHDVMFHNCPMWSRYVVNPTAFVGGYLFWTGEDYGYVGGKIAEEFQYTDRLAGIGYPHTIRREFTRCELLLERAEAKIMTADYTGALSDLIAYTKSMQNFSANNVRTYQSEGGMTPLTADMLDSYYSGTRRNLNPNCFANWDFTQNMSSSFVIPEEAVKYMNCLNDLRRFETLWDGLRFFDLKRWGIEYEHRYGADNTTYRLAWDDPRRAIEVPADAIAAGLEPSQPSTMGPTSTEYRMPTGVSYKKQ